ncbi:hypothetical protein PIB30_100858 [Stylosanthes scabra]|uniref:Uncharacterized protein n=1 Tax=Stylosanthes scabra TaxID=79078 RepID=A0ABU6VWH4_9FABA|nr:hypothetical protein [Stylosanthes scabra]
MGQLHFLVGYVADLMIAKLAVLSWMISRQLSKLAIWAISLGRPIMIPIQTHSMLVGKIIRISIGEEIKGKESTTTFMIKIVFINPHFRDSSLIKIQESDY